MHNIIFFQGKKKNERDYESSLNKNKKKYRNNFKTSLITGNKSFFASIPKFLELTRQSV